MTPLAIAGLVFVCSLGGALVGIRLRTRLPGHHLSEDSKDTVKLGIGLIATMTALVLGLVTASAKSAFDELDMAVKVTAGEVLTLDRVLARYGPETHELRVAVREGVGRRIDLTWPPAETRPSEALDPSVLMKGVEALADRILALSPQTHGQRYLQSRAVDLSEDILEARWLGFGGVGSSIPSLFLVMLLLWLTVTFGSFGLFAPLNGTVLAVLVVCALSVAGAVFLIYEMNGAFEGLIRVSADPLRFAYDHMNQ